MRHLAQAARVRQALDLIAPARDHRALAVAGVEQVGLGQATDRRDRVAGIDAEIGQGVGTQPRRRQPERFGGANRSARVGLVGIARL